MISRKIVVLGIVFPFMLVILYGVVSASLRTNVSARDFEFTYLTEIPASPAGARTLRIWIPLPQSDADRKSTRLNSSHSQISYAVFCLKIKTIRKLHAPHSY